MLCAFNKSARFVKLWCKAYGHFEITFKVITKEALYSVAITPPPRKIGHVVVGKTAEDCHHGISICGIICKVQPDIHTVLFPFDHNKYKLNCSYWLLIGLKLINSVKFLVYTIWVFVVYKTVCKRWPYPESELSRNMTKPTKWVCTQRRLRSTWASAQSNQRLCCPHEESFGPKLPIKCTAETLIRLGRCTWMRRG